MIEISSKVKYAILALLELERYYGRGLLQTKGIAEKYLIPANYLEQLMGRLNKAGIVHAVRGNKGGYELARHPQEITFLEIWEALEGNYSSAQNHANQKECNALSDLYRQAEEEIKKVFRITLSELARRQQAYEEMKQEGLMFHI